MVEQVITIKIIFFVLRCVRSLRRPRKNEDFVFFFFPFHYLGLDGTKTSRLNQCNYFARSSSFFFFSFSFSLKMKCNETYSKISFPFFLSFRSQIQGSGFDFLLPVVNIKPHCIQVYFPHFVQLGFSLGFLWL